MGNGKVLTGSGEEKILTDRLCPVTQGINKHCQALSFCKDLVSLTSLRVPQGTGIGTSELNRTRNHRISIKTQ
jgi:hypothetical protein